MFLRSIKILEGLRISVDGTFVARLKTAAFGQFQPLDATS
jgi:hypothetical protein